MKKATEILTHEHNVVMLYSTPRNAR